MLLELEAVQTYIGQFHILQGVSLAVPEGGITVLLGRNGAGKTTTLRTIMGLVPARVGEVRLRGQDITRLPPHAVAWRGLGYVPEDRGVFGQLTVEENLRVAVRGGDLPRTALRRGKNSAAQQRLERVFSLFPDLRQAWRRRAGLLSGGQQQMLAIARAMVNENALLLIDEPSKGLAPIVVEHLGEDLRRIALQTTILLVEQNFALAAAIGDRYCIIDDGRTVKSGAMPELVADAELKRKYLGVA